jgi:enoyl-[acyl-carrier protein] reductase I
MIDFSGKRGVVLGVGNQRSIAWAIAERLHQQGADVGLTYLKDPKGRFEANVRKLGEQISSSLICECDVASDESIQGLIREIEQQWGEIDFIVHSVAFADTDDLSKPFSATLRDGFRRAMDVSAYSLLPLTHGVVPMMRKRGTGSILSLSFIGSTLAVPNYNVMGPAKAALEASTRYLARELGPDNIRVNTLSPGAIRTLSSSGIKDISGMIRTAAEHSAMLRTASQEEVANTAAFMLSDAASAITGQVLYVDCGYSIMAN